MSTITKTIGRATMDRLPPHSLEAEQGVLGSILLAPAESLGQCVTKLEGSSVFYDLRHQTIYDALVRMFDAQQAIDLITLQQQLKNEQLLDQVGGLAYLSALPDVVPSAANLPNYIEIVREKFVLRSVLRTCTDAIGKVYECEGDVDGLLDQVEREVLRINEGRALKTGQSIRELVVESINTIEEYHQRQGAISGIATGFNDFDRMTSGLHGGEMVVIAARPSMGKTSLAMNIAEHAALQQKLPVGVFSLEMTARSLVTRMICSHARVNMRNVRDGFLTERDFPRMTLAASKIQAAPLHIDDTSGLSVLQLRAKARRMYQQHGVRLLVVDYLQLLNSTNRRANNREQEIADISCGLKALAKELDVPVVVLSQLNREVEKDKKRKPRLSDLRESGAIEQDADLVGLLYKPDRDDDDDEGEACAVNLLIAKQRSGPTGDVHLTFLKPYTRFESAAKITDEPEGQPSPRTVKAPYSED